MRLPNGSAAVVDIRKLREYCLSPSHPEGRHKARRFRETLGLDAYEAEVLAERLREAARDEEALVGAADPFGVRYTIEFEMRHNDKHARVRSAWIIRANERVPRLTTCYVVR